jgi:hypothetical protein
MLCGLPDLKSGGMRRLAPVPVDLLGGRHEILAALAKLRIKCATQSLEGLTQAGPQPCALRPADLTCPPILDDQERQAQDRQQKEEPRFQTLAM